MILWREIPGFEGFYEISSTGVVRRCCDKKVIAPFETPKGYIRIDLRRFGYIRRFYVHQLVALAFIPNPENKPYVNHKDSVRNNNCVENLEWCTAKENSVHGYKYGYCHPVGEKMVTQLDMDGNSIKVWKSVSAAARAVQCTPTQIRQQILGKITHCKGFKWRYATFEDKHTTPPPKIEI